MSTPLEVYLQMVNCELTVPMNTTGNKTMISRADNEFKIKIRLKDNSLVKTKSRTETTICIWLIRNPSGP